MKWFSCLLFLALLTASGPVWAQGPEEKYLNILNLIDRADSLSESGQNDSAKAGYKEAQAALLNLKRDHPTWNVKVVSYRLKDVANEIAKLSKSVPTPGAASAETESKSGTLPASTQVKLLDAGSEPRQTLRVQAKPGEKQTVEMTVKSAMGMGAGAAQGEMMKMPAMKMTVNVLPKSVSAEGDIHYELLFEEIGIVDEPGSMPQMAEAMKASLRGVKGLKIVGTMADRGFSKKAEIIIPPGTDPLTRVSMEQMKDSFSNTEFLLPQEAVGPGAKWEVKQKLKTQGMTIDQTTTYHLVSIDGGVLSVNSSNVQHAANQKIPNPAMPQLKADLTKLAGTGSGSMTIDLAKVLPSQASMEDHTEMTLGMDAAGQKQTMSMKTDTTISLETK